MTRKAEVTVRVTIEVDRDAYEAEYGGEEFTLDDIRDDLEFRVVDSLEEHLRPFQFGKITHHSSSALRGTAKNRETYPAPRPKAV